MGLYRRKPISVEAFRFEGKSNTDASVPDWFVTAINLGVIVADVDCIVITSATPQQRAEPGDWIVREPDGEIIVCWPAMFAATYDAADAATSIERNQIVTPAQLPGRDEHTLERLDDAEAKDYAGPPVTIAPYRRPADKRVKTLLDDAARNRAAEGARETAAPVAIFTDPRLDPNYKPPKKR